MATPTPAEVEGWLKTLAAGAGLVGGAWAILSRWLGRRARRRRADAELSSAIAEALRVSLDGERAVLERLASEPEELTVDPEEWLRRCAVLRSRVDDARNRLWVALGYPDPRGVHITPEERAVLSEMSRTLRLRAREMSPEERAAYLDEQRRAMRRAEGLPEDEGPLFKDEEPTR
jgi:hypothetical protein